MNLINDPWIPVRRRSGAYELIAPWQLTDGHAVDPITGLSSPRADFDGALMQFLIGTLQVMRPPQDDDDWFDAYAEPPTPTQLHKAMAAHADSFHLIGTGPVFMQDTARLDGKPRSIASLLIEMPGENTAKNNVDFFVKRGGVGAMCPACVAAALFCLQTNAPAGGAGHRTSLRGGGPLSTLIVADPRSDAEFAGTLWRNVWLNVLDRDVLADRTETPDSVAAANIFPWLAATRTSEPKTGTPTTPGDVHPLQMYWGMPRRIRLIWDEGCDAACSICACQTELLCSSYLTKNYGVDYVGAWRHPLSPHNVQKDGQPTAMKPQPGGLAYRHWLGLVQGVDSDKIQREPAQVLRVFNERRVRDVGTDQHRLWAFGYDMDNMKARCWYESTMPLYHLQPEQRKRFEDNAGKLVFAATQVASNLRAAVRKAWFRRPQDKKGDVSFITSAFWQVTEGRFYGALGEIHGHLHDAAVAMAKREAWLRYLGDTSLALFDQWALAGTIEDSDPRRITLARNDLRKFNRSAAMLAGLGLPTIKQKQQQKPTAAAQGEPA